MRIVAGRHRGRTLAAPSGGDTRPTADRVREALFNVLQHGLGVELDGATVLDLFAGTGALGLEAVSRGAAYAVFVESGRAVLDLIRANIASLGEEQRTLVLRRDATRLGAPSPGIPPARLVFLDPPYGENLALPALTAAAERRWLAPQAVCVVETRTRETFEPPPGFARIDTRTYGGTRIDFLRYDGDL